MANAIFPQGTSWKKFLGAFFLTSFLTTQFWADFEKNQIMYY